MALLLFVCVLFQRAHKSLAPRARTLLGGMVQATLSFFAVATLLFFFFCKCPKVCDLAKQRRKMFGGVPEVGKEDFSLYFICLCVFFLVFVFFCCAVGARPRGFRQYRPTDREVVASTVAAVTIGPVAAWPAQLLPHVPC